MLDWIPAPLMRLLGSAADSWGWLGGKLNRLAINTAVGATRNRPHPWSTVSDYISWRGLSDRTFLARHLPPPKVPDGDLPAIADVMKLFARPAGTQRLSDKSTCLFPAFAQYLTDSFIRTDTTHDNDPTLKRRMTTSNHEIDLCPLYGRTVAQTNLLRRNSAVPGQRGRLDSQMIGTEEFPQYMYLPDGVTMKPKYAGSPGVPGLDEPLGTTQAPNHLATLFAVGGDRANATPFVAMINTLLLREHNRVAGELEKRNPGWDDERVFQTARNIMIVMFIKIVVEEYINHIAPIPFRLRADPSVAWTANWNRPNWITAEFSLLYRWHSLIPDPIVWADRDIATSDILLNNEPLVTVGLAKAFAAASAQTAGDLGAFNTSAGLSRFEYLAIDQARTLQIDTYNAYRVQFGGQPAKQFSDISSDAKVQTLLKALYGTPDRVEFYPGLFAEDRLKNSALPGLLMTMVAVDAFSQALTNPLLSEHVYTNTDTFTDWGLELINSTGKLEHILARNVAQTIPAGSITMTLAGWKYR